MSKYFNPRLLNAVIAGTGMKNPVRPHVILGSEDGEFVRGDLMDANAIQEFVGQKIAELVDSAPEALDTLKELSAALNDDSNFATTIVNAINQKQDTLVSGVNIKTINGSSILGEGNIVLDTSTYKGLPETWDTTHSMAELIASINADSNAVPGKSYLGTVQLSDLPAGMTQAELIIDIMDQLSNNGSKVVVFHLSSADISPYKWEYTSAYGRAGAWRSWVIEQQQADWNLTNISAVDYIKNKPDVALKEDVVTIEAPVNATDATQPITSLTCVLNKYYRIGVPIETLSITLPSMTNVTTTKTVTLYLTGGTAPDPLFASADTGVKVYFADGFEVQSGSTYEISCLWNGVAWIVASATIVVPHDYAEDYLTFVAKESGTFTFTPTSSNVISYSTDNGTTWTEGNSVSVNNDDKVMWKGAMTPSSSGGIGTFSSTGNFDAQGNVMSLLFGDNFKGQTGLTGKDYAFCDLFNSNTKVVNAENLSLPATTLADNCYSGMFNGCTSLVNTPRLPATTLADNCYSGMFNGCTSLTTAPELLAETLTQNCYANMFYGCTSLVTAPELPATTLAYQCYGRMFVDCTSLTTAPELPATTLIQYCYEYMFKGCTSLTTAPELPAKKLVKYCYNGMFYNCTSLNYIKAMFTTTPSGSYPNYYTQNWVDGVAATGTFVKNSTATWNVTGVNGVPTGWTVETASAQS